MVMSILVLGFHDAPNLSKNGYLSSQTDRGPAARDRFDVNLVSSYLEQRSCKKSVLLIVKQVWNNILTDIFDKKAL